jgi:hypothetical protein
MLLEENKEEAMAGGETQDIHNDPIEESPRLEAVKKEEDARDTIMLEENKKETMAGGETQDIHNDPIEESLVAVKKEDTKKQEDVKKKEAIQKEDLWRDPLVRKVGDSAVHMTGLGSDCHIVFARVAEGPALSIGTVVDIMVDEGWKQVAKAILEKRVHIQTDSYPPAKLLLELGAVWLLNETKYTQNHDAHAHRLFAKDETLVPEWKDMTIRVHYVPDRFHAADQCDWTKYCRGLLVGQTVEARIGDEVPHVPVPEGLPDTKDGVIVYEVGYTPHPGVFVGFIYPISRVLTTHPCFVASFRTKNLDSPFSTSLVKCPFTRLLATTRKT